ncbi:MAG: hypothetical protein WC712_13195 [Candidatus Brocadiia bacterium]
MRRIMSSLIILLMAASCSRAQQWSEGDLRGLEIYPIKGESQYYKNLVAKLGEVLIAYKYAGLTYRNDAGDFVNVIEYVFLVADRGGKLTILGKIERSKIIDAYGKVLYDMSKEDASLLPNVVGVSSSILNTLTQPCVVAVGKEKSGASFYYETETLMPLDFDVQRSTIVRAKTTY